VAPDAGMKKGWSLRDCPVLFTINEDFVSLVDRLDDSSCRHCVRDSTVILSSLLGHFDDGKEVTGVEGNGQHSRGVGWQRYSLCLTTPYKGGVD